MSDQWEAITDAAHQAHEAAQNAFIAAEINYKATPRDRGGKQGPKGRAYQAVIVARKRMMEALAAYNEKRGERK